MAIVASDNLGTLPGLVAGASLVTDYVLTVSVSVASGIAALTSAFPVLLPWHVIKASLLFRPGKVSISVPYHLGE